jgi:hypothetical protein
MNLTRQENNNNPWKMRNISDKLNKAHAKHYSQPKDSSVDEIITLFKG